MRIAHRDRSQSPVSTRRSFSSDNSSDVESTTSSTMIKKRPAKPQINLNSASFSDLAAREDGVFSSKHEDQVQLSEMQVTPVKVNPVQQSDLNRMPDRPDSAGSSTSYLNLAEENASLKCLSDDYNEISPKSMQKISNSECTLINTKSNEAKIYNGFRSNSPTSKLLQPIFRFPMSEDVFKLLEGIRAEISPKLSRLERLENENKLLAVLQVKLAVLQEEKRQLLNTLKQKRSTRQSMSSNHSSKTSSPLSSPVSFQSEADDVFVIRPHPHRAKISKSVQTEETREGVSSNICPYCRRMRRNSSVEDVGENNQQAGIRDNAPLQTKQNGEEIVVEQTIVTSSAEALQASNEARPKLDRRDAYTETIVREMNDVAVGREAADQYSANASTQCLVQLTDACSQHDDILYENKSILAGCSCSEYSDFGIQCSPAYRHVSFGDDVAVKAYNDKGIQHKVLVSDKEVVCRAPTSDKSSMCGCCLDDRIPIGCQAEIPMTDFTCGDGFAVVESVDDSCQAVVHHTSVSLSPIEWERRDSELQCNLDEKQSRTIGLGDDMTDDILCEKCLNSDLVSVGIGAYNSEYQTINNANDNLCRVDDKLCECFIPESCEKGTGDSPVDHIVCDSCRNRTFETVACSDDRIDSLLCDTCESRQLESRGCGDDNDVNFIVCDECARKPSMQDTGIGDSDVFSIVCNNCRTSADISGYVNVSIADEDTELTSDRTLQRVEIKGANNDVGHGENVQDGKRLSSVSSETEFCEEVYRIMANSTVCDNVEQRPVICNYCGNKVDINDTDMDSALNEMRSNLASFGRNAIGAMHTVDNLAELVDDENDVNEEGSLVESDDEEEELSER